MADDADLEKVMSPCHPRFSPYGSGLGTIELLGLDTSQLLMAATPFPGRQDRHGHGLQHVVPVTHTHKLCWPIDGSE